MAKKVVAQVKLQVPAGKANPSPPVGPALGQHGVNIMEFCKAFNAQTQAQEGLTIPVVITVYSDRSFTFITKTPPAAVLLKQAAGIAQASKEPNRVKVGKVTRKQVEEIARTKMPDLNAFTLEAAVKIDDAGDYIFHGILFVIVGLAVLNAVLMSVLNRKREFGVLRALGLRRVETGAVVFGEGVLLTLASGAAGMILGFAITWIFWRNGLDLSGLMGGEITMSGTLVDPVIVPAFRLSAMTQSLGFILVIGILASLYPAQQAMRIDVAEAMKFER